MACLLQFQEGSTFRTKQNSPKAAEPPQQNGGVSGLNLNLPSKLGEVSWVEELRANVSSENSQKRETL